MSPVLLQWVLNKKWGKTQIQQSKTDNIAGIIKWMKTRGSAGGGSLGDDRLPRMGNAIVP